MPCYAGRTRWIDRQAERIQMEDQDIRQTLQRLEEQQQQLLAQLAKSENKQKRDFWDKLAAISPIMSGMAIALSALLCTYQYNQQQIKLQEAQTVERFIPHLMGNDTSKRMAILAMKTLVNTDLAAKYAAMFPSAGTISALKTIARNGDRQDKEIVSKVLNKTADQLSAEKNPDDVSIETLDHAEQNPPKLTHPDQVPANDPDVPSLTIPTDESKDATIPGDAKKPAPFRGLEESLESPVKRDAESKVIRPDRNLHIDRNLHLDRSKPTATSSAQDETNVEL